MSENIPRFFLYGEADKDAGLHFLHVETIPARSILHDWHIAPHRHPNLFQLLLAVGGGGELRADSLTRDFMAPILVTVPPGVVHGYRFQPGTEGWVITLSDSFAGEILGPRDAEIGPVMTEARLLPLAEDRDTAQKLHAHFAAVEDEFRNPGLGSLAAIAAHIRLVFVLQARLRQADRQAALSRDADAALFARFRNLVEQHYREHLAVSAYAKQLAVTEKRLTAACRRVAEKAPLDVIHARLLIEAKRNLLYTSMTIAEAGYALGFRDPAYFTRFFTRRAGMAPKQFKSAAGHEALHDPNQNLGT
jgi:AraC family transcriptional activator of pobA